MSDVVLDSGILIASVFPETLTPKAKQLIQQLALQNVQLHAPNLLHYELVAVSRKAVYQGRVTPDESLRALQHVLNYPFILHFDDALLKRGYELATEYNRPTAYDAQYLALSERLACDFWTTDERLFNAVNTHLPMAHWLNETKLNDES